MADSTSAQNQWVESYLEALLGQGLSSEYTRSEKTETATNVDADRDVTARYYLNSVLQMGEEGIRDAWSKATSSRHTKEKDLRLEHLSWRVWFMKRKKAAALLEKQKASGLPDDTKDHLLDDTSDDDVPTPRAVKAELAKSISKELSLKPEIGKGMLPATVAADLPRLTKKLSVTTVVPKEKESSKQWLEQEYEAEHTPQQETPPRDVFENRVNGLYIILISLHGLVRGEHMELGKDPDTGGQVKYVVELARALACHPAVFRVDLLTRLIDDPKVDKSYAVPEECLLPAGSDGGMGGAYIVRLPCGPREYIRKEKLWPHIREFADRGIVHAKQMLQALSEARTPCELYVVHGHYADAGEVAALMSSTLDIDMVMTGHSLGRNKLEHLAGTMTRKEIEETYKISRRIEAEERALETAVMVFTSTFQEVLDQWGLYDGYDRELEAVLRNRRRTGRHMPYMNVIPPGLDFSNLKVDLPEDPAIKEMMKAKYGFGAQLASPHASRDGGDPLSPTADAAETAGNGGAALVKKGVSRPGSRAVSRTGSPRAGAAPAAEESLVESQFRLATNMTEDPPIWQRIFSFGLLNPRKPCILAMSRPDAKKNLTTLVQAYGENRTLRNLANLVLVMGNRDNIASMAPGSQKVIRQVMELIDTYDLWGSVSLPKKHTQKDISDIYRLAFFTHGIFVNAALQEPFGLTVIEAAAHGVPTVATKNGGPVDIMSMLHHGLLVDPTDPQDIAEKMLKILTNPQLWDQMSQNGVNNIMAYSWPSHCKRYLESIEMEKRFLRHHLRREQRLSGTWDHATHVLEAGAQPSLDAPSMSLPSVDRTSLSRASTAGPHMLDDRSILSSQDDTALNTSDTSTSYRTSLFHDRSRSLSWHRSSSGQNRHSSLQGAQREKFIVIPLDGSFRAATVAHLLKKIGTIRGSAPSASRAVGVGLVSMLGLEHTSKVLKEQGVKLGEVDWIVCHGGADIWHAKVALPGQEQQWVADEQWEQHIDFRWDRNSVAKMVTKVFWPSTREDGAVLKTAGTLLRALDNLRPETEIHPHHVLLELDDEAKQLIADGQKEAVSLRLLDRLRRRLRQNGYRTHLTLRVVPRDGELISNVHITPLRGSRALSLRWIANKFGLEQGMEAMTVLAVPPKVSQQGDQFFWVSTHSSDLAELISGVQQVYVAKPPQDEVTVPSRSAAADVAVMDRMAVKVAPAVFQHRIRFLQDADTLEQVLACLVAGKEVPGYVDADPPPA
eukprot:jgi/Botrbrau1/13938/Bobra.0193s0005.1